MELCLGGNGMRWALPAQRDVALALPPGRRNARSGVAGACTHPACLYVAVSEAISGETGDIQTIGRQLEAAILDPR